MKKINLRMCFFAVSLIFLFSCSKDNQEASFDNTGSKKLMIRISGIQEPIDNDDKSRSFDKNASINNTSKNSNQEIDPSHESQNIGDIKVQTSFTPENYGDEVINEGVTQEKHNKYAATNSSNINVSVKYRFILFKKNDNNTYTFIGYKDASKNSTYESTAFEVLKGHTYKWIAYSYNTADNITDVINSNSYSIETSITKDLLYASNEFEIPNNTPGESEDLKIDILFKHRLARIAITLKANNFPAIIRNFGTQNFSAQLATNSQEYFSKGQLNLLNNSLSNNQKVKFENPLPFTAASNNVGDSTRIAYLYTSNFEEPLKDITIKVNYLMFQDIYSYRDGNYPSIQNKEITVNTRNKNAQPGFSYSSTINFLNSDGIIKGNIIWARGNLTYNPKTNTFRINKTPNGYSVNAENDYWMYNSLTPWDQSITNNASHRGQSWSISKDPCRQIAGGWRLPTKAEILALGGINTPKSDRRQADNWDNASPVRWGTARPIVNIPQNSYTSFRGDDGQWVTFFKTAIMNTDYNRDFSKWDLTLNDSALIAVSDGDAASGGNFNFMQIDGEQNFFKLNDRALRLKIGVRCVKNITL